MDYLELLIYGFFAGVMAGVLGVGGGTIIVPLLVSIGRTPIQAVATSNLAILITSISGSFENYRKGGLDLRKVSEIGIAAIASAQLGAYIATQMSARVLAFSFAGLLIISLYLMYLRKKISERENEGSEFKEVSSSFPLRLFTGACGGILSGLFGVGGGVVMVPMLVLLLNEKMKEAIRTSLGVIIFTAISATIGHSVLGNIIYEDGILVGMGGLVGAQVGTRFLPKIPDRAIKIVFAFFVIFVTGLMIFKGIKL